MHPSKIGPQQCLQWLCHMMRHAPRQQWSLMQAGSRGAAPPARPCAAGPARCCGAGPGRWISHSAAPARAAGATTAESWPWRGACSAPPPRSESAPACDPPPAHTRVHTSGSAALLSYCSRREIRTISIGPWVPDGDLSRLQVRGADRQTPGWVCFLQPHGQCMRQASLKNAAVGMMA